MAGLAFGLDAQLEAFGCDIRRHAVRLVNRRYGFVSPVGDASFTSDHSADAAFAGMFVFGLAILWSFYGFRHYAIPNATERSISVADYIKENGRPESVQSVRVTDAISHTPVFPESYVLGMADVIAGGTRNS